MRVGPPRGPNAHSTPPSLIFCALVHTTPALICVLFRTLISIPISSSLIVLQFLATVPTKVDVLRRLLHITPPERLFFAEGGLLKQGRMGFDGRRNLSDALCQLDAGHNNGP